MQSKNLTLIRISMFAAIATIVSFFSVPVTFAPEFYKLDFSNAFVLISGFSLGSAAGFSILFIKIFLRVMIKGSFTMGIGELASFITGIAIVWPSAKIYKRYRTFKGACFSLCVGAFSEVLVSVLMNYFVLLPLYGGLLATSEEAIVKLVQKTNPLITDKLSFVLLAALPFNLLEAILICTLTLMLYKKCTHIISEKSKKCDEFFHNRFLTK